MNIIKTILVVLALVAVAFFLILRFIKAKLHKVKEEVMHMIKNPGEMLKHVPGGAALNKGMGAIKKMF